MVNFTTVNIKGKQHKTYNTKLWKNIAKFLQKLCILFVFVTFAEKNYKS